MKSQIHTKYLQGTMCRGVPKGAFPAGVQEQASIVSPF